MWPFKRKPVEPPPPRDGRQWNEDWKVGDIAECIIRDSTKWGKNVPPWHRPAFGQRFTVIGFTEGPDTDGNLRYFLRFEDWPVGVTTTSFRKVRPVAAEQSAIVEQILNAKPGTDRKREDA